MMTHEQQTAAYAVAQQKKKPANPVIVLIRGLLKRCPNCGHGNLYRGWVNIKEQCPHCQITLQPYAGDALGVYAVAYFLTLAPALAVMILAFLYLRLSYMQMVGLFGVVDGVLLFGLFPNFKTMWISMVYLGTGLRPRL